jgi:hypothetical protein
MTRHVFPIGGDLSPDAHSPASGELFKDEACGVFVELVSFRDGSVLNPLWAKTSISPQVDDTELFGSILNIAKSLPVLPGDGLGATVSLVVGLADTYDHRDTLSSKEIVVNVFDQFFSAANFLAGRTIPGYEGLPSHLVTFGVMIAEHIYLVHGPKDDEPLLVGGARNSTGSSHDAWSIMGEPVNRVLAAETGLQQLCDRPWMTPAKLCAPRALDQAATRAPTLNDRVKRNRRSSAALAGKRTFAADTMGDGNAQIAAIHWKVEPTLGGLRKIHF